MRVLRLMRSLALFSISVRGLFACAAGPESTDDGLHACVCLATTGVLHSGDASAALDLQLRSWGRSSALGHFGERVFFRRSPRYRCHHYFARCCLRGCCSSLCVCVC